MARRLSLRSALVTLAAELRAAVQRIAAKRRAEGPSALAETEPVAPDPPPTAKPRKGDPWYRDERRKEVTQSPWLTRRSRWLTRE
jgi:hypothetical protein